MREGMMERIRKFLRRLAREETGQNLAEYALIVISLVLTVFLVMNGFMDSVATYHRDITSLLCLPVP